MRLFNFIILSIIPAITVAQKHCKCDAKDIANWKYKEIGKNDDVLKGQPEFQHPVTTFYRNQGSWYNPNESQTTNLASLRKLQFAALDNKHYRDLYEKIFKQALTINPPNYNLSDATGKSDFTAANTAKAAAFVLLMGFDDDGEALSDSMKNVFKTQAINIIFRLDNSNGNNPDDKYYAGWHLGKYTSNHYWVEKNLITLLMAYDYLKAVYPNDSDVNKCGDLLHCYSRHIFLAGTQLFGTYSRLDNHALMTAGAIGLASVVLADKGASRLRDSWHPDRWANASIWKILKTLYEAETAKGGVHGFGEGAHYAKHSLEHLMPFFLAYKIATPVLPLDSR